MVDNGSDQGTKSALVSEGARLDAVKHLNELWVDTVVAIKLEGVSS
jgi:hypothetical protein